MNYGRQGNRNEYLDGLTQQYRNEIEQTNEFNNTESVKSKLRNGDPLDPARYKEMSLKYKPYEWKGNPNYLAEEESSDEEKRNQIG